MGTAENKDPAARKAVLREAATALQSEKIPFVAIGSIAGSLHAGIDWEHEGEDIDFFIFRDDIERALPTLRGIGYETPDPEEDWLRKAVKDGVLVDLIWHLTGGVTLDEDMLARAIWTDVADTHLPVMPAEDYAISQSISASPDTPAHWFNAARTLQRSRIDRAVFERRSSWHPERVHALEVFARTLG